MSDEALTDIANAIMHLRRALQKHGLDVPVAIQVADREQMIRLGIMLRARTQLNYHQNLDAPLGGGELVMNVCGVQISAKVGPDMRRRHSIAFYEPMGEQP